MLPRHPAQAAPDASRPDAPAAQPADHADTPVPTLRQILVRYRQQGTVPGQMAAGVTPVAAPAADVPAQDDPARRQQQPVPSLASLRSLFLDSTAEPTLDPITRDAWMQPPRKRR